MTAFDEFLSMMEDRCSYCGEFVDRSTPEGEAEGQKHDNEECDDAC